MTVKNGLISENGELRYYKDDKPYHAGVIKVDGAVYYIGRDGRAVKGVHIVHREMGNDILKRGTYTFGEDYKLIKGSYKAPKDDSKSKKSKKKSKSKPKKSGRTLSKKEKARQKIWIIGMSAAILALLSAFVIYLAAGDTIFPDTEQTSDGETVGIVSLPEFKGEVLLCSDAAKKLYDGEIDIVEAIRSGDPYRAFLFEYEIGRDGRLLISENPDLSDAKEYILSANKTLLTIDNLKTGTEYYYKVSVGEETDVGSFTTAKGTRYLKVDGIGNLRDIGGYKTSDGKTVKQGMIIRGSELDGLGEATYYLTADNLNYFKNEFGFVYDFDLRNESIYAGEFKTRLGDGVGHKFYSSSAYGAVFGADGMQSVKEIFSDLADVDKYPMYLHCTYGADRTGTIVFLLQGVLGMSETDMLTEYRRTGFTSSKYADSTNIDVLISGLESYQGDTLQEKIIDYLVNGVGVTESEIESIRNILLEE